jgi:hypothetical protein
VLFWLALHPLPISRAAENYRGESKALDQKIHKQHRKLRRPSIFRNRCDGRGKASSESRQIARIIDYMFTSRVNH